MEAPCKQPASPCPALHLTEEKGAPLQLGLPEPRHPPCRRATCCTTALCGRRRWGWPGPPRRTAAEAAGWLAGWRLRRLLTAAVLGCACCAHGHQAEGDGSGLPRSGQRRRGRRGRAQLRRQAAAPLAPPLAALLAVPAPLQTNAQATPFPPPVMVELAAPGGWFGRVGTVEHRGTTTLSNYCNYLSSASKTLLWHKHDANKKLPGLLQLWQLWQRISAEQARLACWIPGTATQRRISINLSRFSHSQFSGQKAAVGARD